MTDYYQNTGASPNRYIHRGRGVTAEAESFMRAMPEQVASSITPEAAFELMIQKKMAEMAREAQDRHAAKWEQEFRETLRRAMREPAVPDGQLALASDKYRLEKLDPRHRMGDLLATCLAEYDRRKPSMGFFDWLAATPELELLQLLVKWVDNDIKKPGASPARITVLKPSTVKAFVQGVAYLDARMRRSYAVGFRGGRMYQNDVLFDTGAHSTVFSGPGWAIYVLSPQKNFYAASHKLGHFHHSSFLQGNAVACAGELEVKQGKLVTLTAKTGHYQTPSENFVRCIQFLRDRHHIQPSSYNVYVKPYSGGGMQDVSAAAFLQDPGAYNVWG